MKHERKRTRHDYSSVDDNERHAQLHSKEFFGIFIRNGRVHVDTKRFHKVLKQMGAEEFWRDGMNANRSTPYLIPKKEHIDDYGVNLAHDIVAKLKKDWAEEFLPAIKAIKTPEAAGEDARIGALALRFGEDASEEAQMIGMRTFIQRSIKYHDVIGSLYCSYIQRIASECDRAMALIFRKRGNVSDLFSYEEFLGHVDELARGDKNKKLFRVKNYRAYKTVRKLDNFLKHHTVKSYQAVKRHCPKYLAKRDGVFQNGMYAPFWLDFPEGFIERILDKLYIFFTDFCSIFLDESADEAEWNNDQYFLRVYKAVRDPCVYYGIYDDWGNSLVG